LWTFGVKNIFRMRLHSFYRLCGNTVNLRIRKKFLFTQSYNGASVIFSNPIYIYVLSCRYIVHGFAFLYNYYNTQTHNTRILAIPNHLPGRSVSSETCLGIKIVVQLYILYINIYVYMSLCVYLHIIYYVAIC